MSNQQQEFISALFNTRNRVRFSMDDRFKPMGITDATWRTLFYLEQHGDGISQKELARVMGIEGPSLVRLLDNLQQKKLISRKPSKQDRRSKTIHLTSNALKQLDSLHAVAADVRRELLTDISAADIETCLKVFRHILAESNEENNDG